MADLVDSYSESNYDGFVTIWGLHPSADGADSAQGQSFTGDGQSLYSCKFYVKVYAGSPGNVIARLYAHTGTFGSTGKPTGAALDSSDIYAAGDFPADFALREFTGFAGYVLVEGTKYCIVLESYDGTFDADNRPAIGRDASTPTHDGNRCWFDNSAWSYSSTIDICFYVYSSPVGWTGKISGVTNPAKIMGVEVANIKSVKGVE